MFTYNIGTECYALITFHTDAEFLLPVKVSILGKFTSNNKTKYKVKVNEIYEANFEYLKEHFDGLKVSMSTKSENLSTLIYKSKLGEITNMQELLEYLDTKPFFIEDNYLAPNKESLRDLYNRFLKYIINHHYKKIFTLMSRSFISNTPMFENQKDLFIRRVEKIGFGDMFEKYDFKLKL